jgi:endonuclease YncB( thermonuclease family)
LLALHGDLVIVGKSPDGDSIRFHPDRPEALRVIDGAFRLFKAGGNELRNRDGTVQLRLEGIDTPETHFEALAQPLGDPARDALLADAGFDLDTIRFDDRQLVATAVPATTRATIFTRAAEQNGRVVAYLANEDALPGEDAAWTRVDETSLLATYNARLLKRGDAYLTLYTTTPALHRWVLRELSAEARAADRGVWAADRSDDFRLDDQSAIGPTGQLILPKLFRRASHWLRARDRHGDTRGFLDWLRASRENDHLVLGEALEVALSAVLEERRDRVSFTPDLLDVVFVPA